MPQILLKILHFDGFRKKTPFCLDTSLTFSMTLFSKFLVDFAV